MRAEQSVQNIETLTVRSCENQAYGRSEQVSQGRHRQRIADIIKPYALRMADDVGSAQFVRAVVSALVEPTFVEEVTPRKWFLSQNLLDNASYAWP